MFFFKPSLVFFVFSRFCTLGILALILCLGHAGEYEDQINKIELITSEKNKTENPKAADKFAENICMPEHLNPETEEKFEIEKLDAIPFISFFTKGHEKANGVECKISFPATWKRTEGESSGIIQKAFTSHLGFLITSLISVKNVPDLAFFIMKASPDTAFCTVEDFKKWIPESSEFIAGGLRQNHKQFQSILWYEYIYPSTFFGRKCLHYIYRCNIPIKNGKIILITFTIANEGDVIKNKETSPENLKSVIRIFMPIFHKILYSLEISLEQLAPSTLTKSSGTDIMNANVMPYRIAAERGEPNSQLELGLCYFRAKDMQEAVKWFRKAAEQGQVDAQFCLGMCYYNGGGVAQDKQEAVKWIRKAAEQGLADAQVELASGYYIGEGVAQDKQEAVKWYRKAAEQGQVDAQFCLGMCYYNGGGVAQDKQEAVKWIRKAAEQGLADAQYNLGICFDNGEGVAQDKQEAVKWIRKAAEQGLADAQYNLGICFDNGEGVAQDKQEAVKWYRKAAEQGQVDAQNNLGICYYSGEGVAQDKQEAVKWIRKAAEQGNADAIKSLRILNLK